MLADLGNLKDPNNRKNRFSQELQSKLLELHQKIMSDPSMLGNCHRQRLSFGVNGSGQGGCQLSENEFCDN